MSRRTLLGGLLAAAFGPRLSFAQGVWPDKPIRLVVPFPPGGSVDPLARVLAQHLGTTFRQQVIVDNRPGGNAVIGTEFVAKAPADGHTLLISATSHVTNPQLVKTGYDPLRDFEPVATLSSSDMVLVVHPSVPAANLREFIALAKSRPGQLNYSSAGSGNPNHLAGELFDMLAGVKTTHVPYKGGAPAVNDLVGGQVQFHYGSPINVMPFIQQGRLKPLAVSSPTRMALLPNVPTFQEAGVPGYQVRVWYGVLAPAGTPREVLDRVGAEINRIVALPETKERLDAAGMERFTLTRQQFADTLRADHEKFGQIIRTAGVKLD